MLSSEGRAAWIAQELQEWASSQRSCLWHTDMLASCQAPMSVSLKPDW